MSDTQRVTFTCKKCDKKYVRKLFFDEHVSSEHAEVLFKCSICSYSSTKKHLFKLHKLTRHTDVKHKCTECEYTHRFPNRVKSHYKQVHFKIPRSLKCRIKSCNDGQKGICELPIHSRLFCDQCKFSSKYTQNLNIHIEMVHDGIVYRCDLCSDFYTNSKKKLNYHKRCVHNPKHFSCEEEGCSFTSKRKEDLKMHSEVKHEGIIYRCDDCPDYKTNSKKKLNYHKRHAASCNSLKGNKFTHSMKYPHHCNMCGKGYDRPFKLRKHMLTHHLKIDKVVESDITSELNLFDDVGNSEQNGVFVDAKTKIFGQETSDMGYKDKIAVNEMKNLDDVKNF